MPHEEEQKRLDAKLLTSQIIKQLAQDYKKARRKLVFLDYDGTLVPFTEQPPMAKPSEELLKILRPLSEDLNTEIVLISGRDRATLQNWFGTLDIDLVAEHGVWIKEKNQNWKMIKPLKNEWKRQILPILERYSERLPGAFVENKDFSIAWHYRMANPELSSIRAKELINDLETFTANLDVEVTRGSKVVEVRNAGVNKGTAGLHFILKNDFDFIMAIGDDCTDEDLFKILPETAYSIRVGMTSSYARFNLHNYKEVINLIQALIS